MKPFLICMTVGVLSCAGAELTDVKTVYLLPMSRGLDQYLAERLTGQGTLRVVTDPKKADAIFSDRIGANFEQSLAELLEEPKVEKADDTNNPYKRPSMQPLSRGKGNIFLVHRESRDVIWSTFVVPKTSDSKDMNHVADDIAGKLAKVLAKKK